MISFRNVYENKKIAIIGNTGFKGSWLTVWLLDLGADVYGISNNIPTEPSHFKAARLSDRIRYIEADIRDAESIRRLLHQIQPDFVFHLAALSSSPARVPTKRTTMPTSSRRTGPMSGSLWAGIAMTPQRP